MKNIYKLFLWESGVKSTEYSQYLVMPIFYEDKLNEELDTAEVVLDAMPANLKIPFAPKTKFRIERQDENGNILKYWDMVVDHDDVEDYVGNGLCCHRIHLIEPSVIAQGMHCDNFALTYELQDVSLAYKTYSGDNVPSVVNPQNSDMSYRNHRVDYQKNTTSSGWGSTQETYTVNDAHFENSYCYVWDANEFNNIVNLFANIDPLTTKLITFNIPRLYCYGTDDNQNWNKKLFEVNTKTYVYEHKYVNGEEDTDAIRVLVNGIESGAHSITAANDDWYWSDGNTAALRTIDSTIPNVRYGTGGGVTYPPASNPYGAFIDTKFYQIYATAPTIATANANFPRTASFTTSSLGAADIENGTYYTYEVRVVPNPANPSGMLLKYCIAFHAECRNNDYGIYEEKPYFYNQIKTPANVDGINVTAQFYVKGKTGTVEYGDFISKGTKYSALELLRKALLTTESRLIDNNTVGLDTIEYPIIVDPEWVDRLQVSKIQETIFEQKNLWEVLLQIGYYLHAIPYLKFAEDGTDRFVLSFEQLGKTETRPSNTTNLTIFNSQNLSDYFTQYDSYVTGIFSPQNIVDEWLTVLTDDESALICNNNAVLKTKYGISEIVDFEIKYNGENGGQAGTKKAISHIFEKSIYQILSADYNVTPSKGDSLYYSLGDNTISGLSYVPPSVHGDMPMALKRIVGAIFDNVTTANIKFNNLRFHIKYRTQDNLRVTQIRPDIQKFMRNSNIERYPHHEQFYGQQDKIVDSERFSLNLWGKLVRVGNSIYEMQEVIKDNSAEKTSGQLYEINQVPYYVTATENEFYENVTLQKVSYSKDFNQISQVVTIPSEPRFYEVSERSKIRREKMEHDFFEITTTQREEQSAPRFIGAHFADFFKKIIFNDGNYMLPNYAWTRFMADSKRQHYGTAGAINDTELFPSSFIDRSRSSENIIVPFASSDHADTILPLLRFPIKDGVVFEWDMEDNFKASDFGDDSITGTLPNGNVVDDAYIPQQAARYVDIKGRADLYSFRLFYKDDWTDFENRIKVNGCYYDNSYNKHELKPETANCLAYTPTSKAIPLDKDCREELSFNYQISLLYRDSNNEGNFVTFMGLFGDKKSRLRCCLIDEEVSMFNENTSVIPAFVLADNVGYTISALENNSGLQVVIDTPPNIDLTKVKAAVFYELVSELGKPDYKVSYLAKNFKNGITENNVPTLYIYPVFND